MGQKPVRFFLPFSLSDFRGSDPVHGIRAPVGGFGGFGRTGRRGHTSRSPEQLRKRRKVRVLASSEVLTQVISARLASRGVVPVAWRPTTQWLDVSREIQSSRFARVPIDFMSE